MALDFPTEFHLKMHPHTRKVLETTARRKNIKPTRLILAILERFIENDPDARQAMQELSEFEEFRRQRALGQPITATPITTPVLSQPSRPIHSNQAESHPLPPAVEPDIPVEEIKARDRISHLDKLMPISWKDTVLVMRWKCEMGEVSFAMYDDFVSKCSPDDRNLFDNISNEIDEYKEIPNERRAMRGMKELSTDGIIKFAKLGLPDWYKFYAREHPQDIPSEGWKELGEQPPKAPPASPAPPAPSAQVTTSASAKLQNKVAALVNNDDPV